jgi:fatty-acyl-CoA synthase
MALVELRKGRSLAEEELLARCRQQLAGFKVPKYLRFVDRLPLSPAGKVLKKELRKQFAAATD